MRVQHGAAGGDERAVAARVEGRRQAGGGAALRAVSRQQEGRVRHQRAKARELLGARGADHRAHGAPAAGNSQRLTPGGNLPRYGLGERRRAVILEQSGAGIGGLDEEEQPGLRGARRSQERGAGILAEVRIHRDGIACGQRATVTAIQPSVGVGLGRAADVAALAIHHNEESQFVRALDGIRQRRDAGGPQPFEESGLRFHGRCVRRDDAEKRAVVFPQRGRGLRGRSGQSAGAERLGQILQARVEPNHRRAAFRVDGRDVYLDLPLAPWEAALGATVDAPLPDGSVPLTVPAGSAPGRKLRLKGKGIPGATPGDLYVVLQIAMPPAPDDAQRRAWEELARLRAFNPRRTMGAQ